MNDAGETIGDELDPTMIHHMLASCGGVVWYGDAGSHVHLAGDAAARVFGCDVAKLSTIDGWLSFVHPDDRDVVEEARNNVPANRPLVIEYRIIRPDGEVRWLRERLSAIESANGGELVTGGLAIDITARRRGEHYEQQMLHALMEHLPDSIYFKDTESRFVRISQALAHRFDLHDPSEATGKSDADFFTDEHAQQARDDEQQVMQSGRPVVDIEEKETWPDGTTTWAATTKSPLVDSEGRLIGTFGISRDITKRKRAEEQLARMNHELQNEIQERRAIELRLQRERDRLRTLMDHLPDLIFVKDEQCRYVMANSALIRFLGLRSLEELVGKTDLDFTAPDLAQQYIDDDLRVIRSGTALMNREETSVDAEGNQLWLLASKVPLCDREGNVTGLVGIARDTTRRKLAESEMQSAKEAADLANRAKGDFLANMSHEIRTPMNAIIGMTELLLETDLSTTQHEYLAMVHESGESLLALINDILDFSKIEADKLELDFTTFDIRESLGDALKSMAVRAHAKGLELAYGIDAGVPERLVGDERRLRQIVVNLVGNAIKFTDSGEVVLRVECGTVEDEGARLHFTVSDTGIGIDQDHRDRIFAEFEQADSSTTRRFGGTGLGLAISQRLIHLMDGRIEVESAVGQGSTFHFSARFRVSSEPLAPVDVAAVEDLNVLVVDDNATNRRILEDMLDNWGMRPLLATSAPEALERLHGAPHEIKLVLCDVNMPDHDGFELVSWIREDPAIRALPIILLTSSGRPGDVERCNVLGVAARLLKPIKQSELFNTIVGTLGTRRGEPTDDPRDRTAVDLPSMNILLAEDNLVNQRLAAGVLEGQGHQVTIVGNGQEAVEATATRSFDAVLMDVQMPVVDGLAATEMIREREARSGEHVPIIAMTAHAMKGDRERCLEAGMDDYIAKPIRLRELSGKLRQCATPPVPESPECPPGGDSPTHVDWRESMKMVNGDIALLKDVVCAFLGDAPRLMGLMRRAIVVQDAGQLKSAAHSLKGAMLSIGAEQASECVWALEQIGSAGDLGQAPTAMLTVEPVLEELCHELNGFLASPSTMRQTRVDGAAPR